MPTSRAVQQIADLEKVEAGWSGAVQPDAPSPASSIGAEGGGGLWRGAQGREGGGWLSRGAGGAEGNFLSLLVGSFEILGFG